MAPQEQKAATLPSGVAKSQSSNAALRTSQLHTHSRAKSEEGIVLASVNTQMGIIDRCIVVRKRVVSEP